MSELRRHTEKSGYVIDIGQFYTKIGLTGEPSPSFVIQTSHDLFLGKLDLNKKNINVIYKQSVRDDQDLTRNLQIYFEDIFFNKFSMDPQGRLVFIVCSMMIPRKFLEVATELLLVKYKLDKVFFVNNLFCPLYLSANYSGITMEIGFTDCMVLPVRFCPKKMGGQPTIGL
jgi:actin-related protein